MLPTSTNFLRAAFGVAATLTLVACTTPTRPVEPASRADAPPAAAAGAPEVVSPIPDVVPEDSLPADEPERVIDPAAAPVVARLARQLRVAESAITVAQVARAEWPNGCLGLAAEGEICTQMITPGYAVSLIVNEQRYEFRTDESGRRIRLAFAPLSEPGDALVTWRDSTSFSVLVVGTQRVGFGQRGGPLLTAPLGVPERAAELVGFMSHLAPFYARTPAGEITFRGVGSGRATATEQRQIAEWARLVAKEADEGLSRRSDDRAFVWRRMGGVVGFCDEVIVSRSGLASAWSCRHPQEEPTAVVAIAPAELEQLYRWLDNFAPFTWESEDPGAVADAMLTSLRLDGQGSKTLTEAERERMLELAHSLVRRLLEAAGG